MKKIIIPAEREALYSLTEGKDPSYYHWLHSWSNEEDNYTSRERGTL
ncbi:hypothetical protein KKG61_09185 [bacterium]|nr:hypothetical protein [bacterium]MBU1600256.1 hypothetical protein [bacterium]